MLLMRFGGRITTMQIDFVYDCTSDFVHAYVLNASHSSGKERDTESGLDYFGARYYASNMGRFQSPDSAWGLATSLASPQTWNQ